MQQIYAKVNNNLPVRENEYIVLDLESILMYILKFHPPGSHNIRSFK
jgi:hypothetical protein